MTLLTLEECEALLAVERRIWRRQVTYVVFFGVLVLASYAWFVWAAEAAVKRSTSAVHKFKQTHVCPSTGTMSQKCPGWIVDHVIPLGCGGPDDPSNMGYQTVEAAKEKDRRELKCEQYAAPYNVRKGQSK